MTMFTPAGEGARIRRRRSKARRTAITLVLAIAMLAGAVYVAWNVLLRDEDDDVTATATPTCTPGAPATAAAPAAQAPPKPVPANRIEVNVFNATSRAGLAANVGEQLENRKFKVRRVANDPLDRKVSGVGELRHGPRGEAVARTLLAHAPKFELVLDRRTHARVDLVLGPAFQKLASNRQAAAALDRAAQADSPAQPASTGC